MTSQATVAELFELAIELEKSAQELYRKLEVRFAHHPEAADFWKEYTAEEAGHAKWLERLRDGLSSEELSASADPLMLREARKMLQISVDNMLTRVKNLRNAYELTNELEHSEMNAIFEFLIDNFAADKKTQDFLRTLLRDHIAKLMLWSPSQFTDLALDE